MLFVHFEFHKTNLPFQKHFSILFCYSGQTWKTFEIRTVLLTVEDQTKIPEATAELFSGTSDRVKFGCCSGTSSLFNAKFEVLGWWWENLKSVLC